MHSPQAIYFFFERHVSVSLVCEQHGRQDVTWKPAISEFRFFAKFSFKLNQPCVT